MIKKILDQGFVKLLNIGGPIRREWPAEFDGKSTDPAMIARKSLNTAGQRPSEIDMKLVKYLLKNKHTTPIEFIEIWLEMKLPIFIARQLIRHRTASVDEVSARYVELPSEWYIPKIEHVGTQPKSIKQGRSMRSTIISNIAGWLFIGALNTACWTSYKLYELAISSGIPKELARCLLHLNHYTHWYWKQDLHNLLHLIRLRRHGHAQYEARVLADAIYEILCAKLPEFMQLWDQLEADEKLSKELLAQYYEEMDIEKSLSGCSGLKSNESTNGTT